MRCDEEKALFTFRFSRKIQNSVSFNNTHACRGRELGDSFNKIKLENYNEK
jgi:hypothetical protein